MKNLKYLLVSPTVLVAFFPVGMVIGFIAYLVFLVVVDLTSAPQSAGAIRDGNEYVARILIWGGGTSGVLAGIALLWRHAKSEKMGGPLQGLDDYEFSEITYRRGASGAFAPVLRGTGIRVQTIVMAAQNNPPAEIAEEYDLTQSQVRDALGFYEVHRAEIDASIQAEAALEPRDE